MTAGIMLALLTACPARDRGASNPSAEAKRPPPLCGQKVRLAGDYVIQLEHQPDPIGDPPPAAKLRPRVHRLKVSWTADCKLSAELGKTASTWRATTIQTELLPGLPGYVRLWLEAPKGQPHPRTFIDFTMADDGTLLGVYLRDYDNLSTEDSGIVRGAPRRADGRPSKALPQPHCELRCGGIFPDAHHWKPWLDDEEALASSRADYRECIDECRHPEFYKCFKNPDDYEVDCYELRNEEAEEE